MLPNTRVIDVLLVEDSETDAELTMHALKQGKIKNTVHHVNDGEKAMDYLLQRNGYEGCAKPDLILLDLNMPRCDGREVLRQLATHDELKVIPVVVLTTSGHDKDVLESYGLAANSYIVKPVELNDFIEVVKQVKDFWLQIVTLPPNVQ